LLATDRAIPIVPRPTENLELVRTRLLDATPTSGASDLNPALERAYAELEKFPGERRLVLVFTDSQKSAWRQRDSVLRAAEERPGIGLQTPSIEPSGVPNMAVTRITLAPSRPTVGEAVTVRAEVANFSADARSGVRVTVATNGGAASDEITVRSVNAGEVAVAELAVSFPEAGLHALTVRIAPDGLPVDDARSTVLSVGKRVEAVVAGASAVGGDAGAPFLLAAARAALGDSEVREVPVSALDPALLETVSAVLLAAPSRVSPATWDTLKKFVEGGGVLAVFPDGSAGLGNTPPTLWLPGVIGATEEKPLRLDQSAFEHPVSRGWKNPEVLPLGDILFGRWYRLSPGKDAQTVIAGNSGEALGASAALGRGQVFVWAFQPTARSTNLVLHPFFPLLLKGVIDMAAGTHDGARDVRPGEAVRVEGPAAWVGMAARVEEIGGGTRIDLSPAEGTETGSVLTIPGMESPGAYRVFVGEDPEPASAFAVTLEATESNLAKAEGIQIEAVSEASAPAAPSTRRAGEMWWWLAVLLVVAFFAELVLARRISASTV
jgi:hypothetical protein